MTMRIVHVGGGIMFPMHEPDHVDRTVAVPHKMQRLKLRAQSIQPRPRTMPFPGPETRGHGPTRFMDRRMDQCAWPAVGGLCCGHKAVKGKSYCDHHDDLAHGRVRPLQDAE